MARFINNQEQTLNYIFKEKIIITGKHATYLKKLTKYTSFSNDPSKEDIALKVFERNINTYMVSTLIGLKFNKKSPIDNSSTELANIVTETLFNDKNAENLEYIYHMVILLDDTTLTEKERVERAFSTDENVIKENKDIFNSYFRGGLELLYNGASGLHENGFKNINTITSKGEPNLESEMDLITELWYLIDGFNREVSSFSKNKEISAEEMCNNMDKVSTID